MSTRNEPWPEGTPCWADLSARDREAAQRFYGDLFGWHIEDTGEEMGHYGIGMFGGRRVAGIGEQPPGDPGPPHWTTYLASDDVDKTCDAISTAGGTVVMAPMQVGTAGRMAIAQDPNGAFFGVWQSGDVIGSELVNEPGTIVWSECLSRHPQQALDFYAAVFGLSFTPMEGEDYWTINGAGPGNMVGGIGKLPASAPAEMPAHWMTYFAVADADDTVSTATQAGGTVQTPPFDTTYGRMAVVKDPQGALFSIAGPVAEVAEG